MRYIAKKIQWANNKLGRDLSYKEKMTIWSMSFFVNVVAALTLSGIPSVAAAIISSFWPGLVIYADDRRLREKGARGFIGFLALILLSASVMLSTFWIGLLYTKYNN